MTILSTCVERYALTVDVRETIHVMLDNAETPWGSRLKDALTFAVSSDPVYPVDPYDNLTLEAFCPDAREQAGLPEVADQSEDRVLGRLERAGYVTVRTVLRETSSETYLSDGRIVTAVEVLRPFALVRVHYEFSPGAQSLLRQYGSAHADRWQMTDRSYIVPVGSYLVGETGDYSSDLVGAAGIRDMSDDVVCALFDLEGFGATRCEAQCDTCVGCWSAESGSWHFRAECSSVDPWYFDDAEGIDENTATIACPECGVGRVGFLIF